MYGAEEKTHATNADSTPSDAAVSVDLDAESLDIIGAVGTSGEVRQIELDLVPAFIQTHGHCTDEGLHACRGLIV